MNKYEEKKKAKKERYQELADKNREKSETKYNTAKQLGEMIPFGQPILIGHHSEGKHRRDIDKIDNNMRKSIEHDKKADYYEHRANNMSTAISSDDPEAINKLKIKLIKLEDFQVDMKEHNAEARANKTEQPFASFQLTNNNAKIKNTRERIERLEKISNRPKIEDIKGNGFILTENKEENRLQFLFDDIPSVEIRKELKSSGFRWSPNNKAWQRHISNRATYLANNIIKDFNLITV